MTTAIEKQLRAYGVRIRGWNHETTIHAYSAGKAKRYYFTGLDLDGVEFTDLRARVLGPPRTTDGITRTAKYRGVEFVRAGMRVQIGDDWGVIVSHNSSLNWDVLFDDDSRYPGQTHNCHPHWEIAYYDEDGNCIKDYRTAA